MSDEVATLIGRIYDFDRSYIDRITVLYRSKIGSNSFRDDPNAKMKSMNWRRDCVTRSFVQDLLVYSEQIQVAILQDCLHSKDGLNIGGGKHIMGIALMRYFPFFDHDGIRTIAQG